MNRACPVCSFFMSASAMFEVYLLFNGVKMSIHKRIKYLREKLNWRVSRLSEEIGVCRYTIYKWERGEASPSREHLLMLAKTLGVSVDEIIHGVARKKQGNTLSTTRELRDQLFQARSFAAIEHHVTKFMSEHGVNNYFYKQIFRGDISQHPNIEVITNIPTKWLKHYAESKYAKIDPAWQYSLQNVEPISNEDLIARHNVYRDDELSRFFDDLYTNLTPCFFVIPVHGACCLATFVVGVDQATREKRERLERALDVMVHVGHLIYAATHRVTENSGHHERILTEKEIEVVQLLANGYNQSEISDRIHISHAAVKSRIANARNKMGASNCEQLVLLAASRNLLPHNLEHMKIGHATFSIEIEKRKR